MQKILLIDDDEIFRDYLAALLTRAGYQVRTLPNGSAVETAVQSEPFAAVVTDLFMPMADGIETIRAVRKRVPTLPVIGVTGEVELENDPCRKAMTVLGAKAVLSKPIDASAFLSALREAIGAGA
ncbi:MAG TPA: response regulator [Stellaceae bacterium]|nr:response regulator [Stellaceae bacterium]